MFRTSPDKFVEIRIDKVLHKDASAPASWLLLTLWCYACVLADCDNLAYRNVPSIVPLSIAAAPRRRTCTEPVAGVSSV